MLKSRPVLGVCGAQPGSPAIRLRNRLGSRAMEITGHNIRLTVAKALTDLQLQCPVYERRRILNILSLGIADLVGLSISVLIGMQLQPTWSDALPVPAWGVLMLLGFFGGASLLHLYPPWGLGPVEEIRRLTILITVVFVGTCATVGLRGELDLSTLGAILVTFGVSAILVPMGRRKVKQLLLRRESWGIPAVVYGRGASVDRIVDILRRERGLGYTPVGTYQDTMSGRSSYFEIAPVPGVPLPGEPVPVAVLSMAGIDRKRTIDLLDGPLSRYRTVIVIPDLFEAPSLWIRPRDLSGVLGLEIRQNLHSPLTGLLKRTVDLTAVLSTILIWLPLCAMIAALIWLEDRSSPFYLQKRVGKNGRPFIACKFRSMYRNADVILQQTLEENPKLEREWALNFKLENDPRVTVLGRWLRKFSLDELPQLWNVLRGEMSLVGPRPLPSYHHDTLDDRVQQLRESVRPGITGLWQVSGRSDAGSSGMEVYDPYYVRNWSLWLDAVILFRTFHVVTTANGAY